ncbi:MAG TPA: twin-arginine translocase subunit TatC [Tenuifilaceae bacterium]|nr:twin-arginine translocase subunit TatC [Tenuifilaceae bacterium]
MAGKASKHNEMTFWQHLGELRNIFIRCMLAVVVLSIVAFCLKDIIFQQVVLRPRMPEFVTNRLLCRLAEQWNSPVLCINSTILPLINIELAGQFTVHLRVAFWSGVIMAFPYIMYELAKFFRPALKQGESTMLRGVALMFTLCFAIGAAFGYFIIAPISIHFLGTYSVSAQVVNQITLGSYLSTVLGLIFAGGAAFEMPVVVLYLSRLGVVKPQFLSRYRKVAIVVILVISAVITPPDVFSMTIVAIPLLLLYEVSVLMARMEFKD